MEDFWSELAEENTKAIAVELLSLRKLSAIDIAKATKLPIEEVEKLAKELTPAGV